MLFDRADGRAAAAPWDLSPDGETPAFSPDGTAVAYGNDFVDYAIHVFHAGDSNRRFLQPVLGARGVLVLDGDEHLATRKRLLPSFHGEAIRRYEQVIHEETEKRIAGWPVGKPIRMSKETRAITLEVIMRTVFGAGDSPQLAELREVLGTVNHVTFVRSLWYVAPWLRVLPPWRG